MERAAHTKAGREERARCGPRTRIGAGVGHLAGQERLCKGHGKASGLNV